MTPPSLPPLRPHPAIPRSLPPHIAKYQRVATTASCVLRISPPPRRPPTVPVAALAKRRGNPSSLPVHITHRLPASFSRLPTRQPLTCAPSAGPPTACILLLARRITLAALRHCLCVRTPPATASEFARRPRLMTTLTATEGEAVAEQAQQEGCAGRPRRPPYSRVGRDARRPRPLPGARAGTRGKGRQRRRKMPPAVVLPAWARCWSTMMLS